MLTLKELVKLERELRRETVLSVYVNGEHRDPARRNDWRFDLRHSFDDIASWLRDEKHAEREAFDACREMAMHRLDAYQHGIGSPGWFGFFTRRGEVAFGSVPAPVPTTAIWSTGASITPYIRVIKEERPVIVGIADAKSVRLYRYAERALELVVSLRPQVRLEAPLHLGKPPRQGFHGGTRGRTGADAAQREMQRGTALMLAEAAEMLAELARGQAWIVVGGIPSVAAAAMTRLAPEVSGKAMQAEHLDVHATSAEIAECARIMASRLRDAADLRRIEEALSASDAGGAGAAGSLNTMKALEEGRVRELYFSLGYLENHAADAEAAVRLAFDGGAEVEHVSGQAAARLDGAGGIAARLLYVPPVVVVAEPTPRRARVKARGAPAVPRARPPRAR